MSMNIYTRWLPLAFPYVAILDLGMATEAVTTLTQKGRSDQVDVSSFALTTFYFGGEDEYHLWLSRVSHDFLYSCILEGMWKHKNYNEIMFESQRIFAGE